MNPLVSIIVPCYNQAQYLDEALQSVLGQTYHYWQCIIVNDGSPDNTEEVAEKWVKQDSRFIYLYKENGGVSSARNLGINYAKGRFILPLDSDDKIGKNYIESAIKLFDQEDDLKLVYSKAELFGERTGVWNLPEFSLFGLAKFNMIFCSAIFKKLDWELVGGYDVNMIYGIEDWEFWIAVLKGGGKVKCLDTVEFFYRIKSESRQTQLDIKKSKIMYDFMSVKHADFFVNQLGSFIEINEIIEKNKQDYYENLKSEKFVINLFTKRFFGFEIFKLKS